MRRPMFRFAKKGQNGTSHRGTQFNIGLYDFGLRLQISLVERRGGELTVIVTLK